MINTSRDRETERQRDRETERQRDRETANNKLTESEMTTIHVNYELSDAAYERVVALAESINTHTVNVVRDDATYVDSVNRDNYYESIRLYNAVAAVIDNHDIVCSEQDEQLNYDHPVYAEPDTELEQATSASLSQVRTALDALTDAEHNHYVTLVRAMNDAEREVATLRLLAAQYTYDAAVLLHRVHVLINKL